MAKRWYVVHAFSGFESHVKRRCEERIKRAGMEDSSARSWCPPKRSSRCATVSSAERAQVLSRLRAGQDGNDRRDLAPGQGRAQGHGLHRRQGRPPGADPRREADAILQRVQEGVDKPRPKVLYEPGEVVRVTDGPFNDFNGVVEEVDYDKSRVRCRC
jgi:transcriptional antiterminator NusG